MRRMMKMIWHSPSLLDLLTASPVSYVHHSLVSVHNPVPGRTTPIPPPQPPKLFLSRRRFCPFLLQLGVKGVTRPNVLHVKTCSYNRALERVDLVQGLRGADWNWADHIPYQ